MRQKRKKCIQMSARQVKQATKIATKVTLNNNKNNSGRGSAAKTKKTMLFRRHLGRSANNNTGPRQCGHCRRMDYEMDNYYDSFYTQEYSRSLPTRIVWSANSQQYRCNFKSDSPPQSMVLFHEESDSGQMGDSHAGRGQQDPGVRDLCRVECKAQYSEKTLDTAPERQHSGATAGALNNAVKMAPFLKVDPQLSNKTSTGAEPSQQKEKSVTTTLMHSSCVSVRSKVRTSIAHQPDTSAETFCQKRKSLVAPSEAGRKDIGTATGVTNQQSMVNSLQHSAIGVAPTIRSSAPAPVQPSAAKLLVPVSNSTVCYFLGAKQNEQSVQSDLSLVFPSGADVALEKEQPTGDFFKNTQATVVTSVVSSATTTLVDMSAARLPVPFSTPYGLPLGSKPTTGTTSGKQSHQSEKSLLAGRSLPYSHSLIGQSSVPTMLGNSLKLNIKFKVRTAHKAGISVDKSFQQNGKSLVISHGAGSKSSDAGIDEEKEQTTRKGTSCLWWSATSKPTQTPSADCPSGTKPEQANKTNSLNKPCQHSEKILINSHHTDHFQDSDSLFGQSSIQPACVQLSNPNVTCRVQVSQKPGTSVDKQSQQSEKNLVTAHESGKQNSPAATRAQREQPIGGPLKKSIEKVTPTSPTALAARSFVSVSESGVYSSGTNPVQTTKSKPVETLAARLPGPFNNSHVISSVKRFKPTDTATSVGKLSHQGQKNLVAESKTSGLPKSHRLIDQSLIPPATNAMQCSSLSTSCYVGIANEQSPSLDEPQLSKTNLITCDAVRQNSSAANGCQSKQPVDSSIKSSSKTVTPYRCCSAATTPVQSLAARALVSNFGSHPSFRRLKQRSQQSHVTTNRAHRKQPMDDSLLSVSNLNNIPTHTKPEQTNENTLLDNQSWHSEKSFIAVPDSGGHTGVAAVGDHTEGNHLPMDGSFQYISNSNVHPTDVNPEMTNKNTCVHKPSQQSDEITAAVHEAAGQSSGTTKGAQRKQLTELFVFDINNIIDTNTKQTNKTTSGDDPSWHSDKSLITVYEGSGQNNNAASEAQREQPMDRSSLSVPTYNVHPTDVNSELMNTTTSVDEPFQQNERSLVAESDTNGLPASHSSTDQSLIPPALMHSSNLNASCIVGSSHKSGPALEIQKSSAMCKAGTQNSGVAAGSQSRQRVEGSIKSNHKKVSSCLCGSAAATPAEPSAARSLASLSNFRSHPSVSRLEQSRGQSSDSMKGAQSKQLTDDYLLSVPKLNNLLTVTKLEQTDKNTLLDNQFLQIEKSSVAVHAGVQTSGAVVGAKTKGSHQPVHGSPLSVSISGVHPLDLNPEPTKKNTLSLQNEKSSAAVLDTSLNGQSPIPNTWMQSSDSNYKSKVRMAHQPSNIREGKSGTRLLSAQVEKQSEVKPLHRYVALFIQWIYSLPFNIELKIS